MEDYDDGHTQPFIPLYEILLIRLSDHSIADVSGTDDEDEWLADAAYLTELCQGTAYYIEASVTLLPPSL